MSASDIQNTTHVILVPRREDDGYTHFNVCYRGNSEEEVLAWCKHKATEGVTYFIAKISHKVTIEFHRTYNMEKL